MYYSLVLEALLLSIMLIFYYLYNKKLSIQNTLIMQLLKKNQNSIKKNEVKSISLNNKRNYYRINLPNIHCEVKFIDFGSNKLEKLKNKQFTCSITDISLGGLKFLCEFELPVKHNITIEMIFSINEEDFCLTGKILRREEHIINKFNTYGVQFIDVPTNKEKRLKLLINNIELEKRKSKNL